jgi:hypothetical protein
MTDSVVVDAVALLRSGLRCVPPTHPDVAPTVPVARTPPWLSYRPPLVATLVAAALVGAYLLAPLMGGDLSAQLARADFAGRNPLTPVDLSWFGGFQPFGYSLWTPWVMAGIGVRLTGALATVVATALATRLMQRGDARRPTWGGVVAAVTLTSNLAEGRVTFACGVVFGLAALLCIGRSRAGLVAAAFLAGAASPVAALLLGVCAVALLTHRRSADGILPTRRRAIEAGLLIIGAGVPAGVLSLVFSDPGRGLFSPNDALRAIAMSVLVAVITYRRPLIRNAAWLGALMVLVLWLLPTPVGVSAARLTLLFGIPVVVAFIRLPRLLVPLAVAVAVLVQSPITIGTLTAAGDPATRSGYYQPLQAELNRLGPLTGRIEVPELTGHWEAAHLGGTMPLARGWLRQTDIGQNNDVFYAHPPNADTYRQFLDRSATEYVAVADAPATFYGRRETALIRTGLPYLHPVWSNPHWTLYSVDQAVPIVAAPGRLVRTDDSTLVLDAPPDTTLSISLRWFDWLSLAGPAGSCIDDRDSSVDLRTGSGGQVTLSSRLVGASGHCR